MKKLLTTLAAIGLSSSITTTTVACAERPVASLDDTANIIGNGTVDMFKWSSSVITSDIYKAKFIDELNSNNIEGTGEGSGYLDLIKGVDKNGSLSKTPYVDTIISDYQKTTNSTTNPEKSAFADIAKLAAGIQIDIYDLNEEANKSVSTWDGSAWTDTADAAISAVKNNDTGVYVMNFAIGLTPVAGNTLVAGARINVTDKNKDTLFTDYYSDVKDNFDNIALTKDSKSKSGYTTGVLDYRYKVQFYFSVS